MNPDEPDTPATSGNRWEPTDAATDRPTDAPVRPADEPPVARIGWVPEYAAPEPAARQPFWSRARVAVAGGAAAVLLAGGLGGFALGRAGADGGDDRFQQSGRPGGPAGVDRDGDGGAGQLPGPPPGDGTDVQPGSADDDTQDS